MKNKKSIYGQEDFARFASLIVMYFLLFSFGVYMVFMLAFKYLFYAFT